MFLVMQTPYILSHLRVYSICRFVHVQRFIVTRL